MRLTERLASGRIQDPIDQEADFKAIWLEQCAGLSPFEMAIQGGLLADRFAWIFTAGYQGAVRHVFPEESFEGWAAFAVSEDRSSDNPLPGVTWEKSDSRVVINGSKTWIAASAHCDDIVFSAGRGGDKRFFRVGPATQGVTVDTRPPGRMLPDLSQGSAHFDNLVLSDDQRVNHRLVAGFGPSEVLYIYAAFLASTWARTSAEQTQALALLELAEQVAAREAISRDHDDMVELDLGVQTLLAHLRASVFGEVDLWRRDYKLVAMYARKN